MKPSAADIAAFVMARDEDGSATGCGALRDLGGGVAEIKRMYVRPECRRRGVGALVLTALEEEARGAGFGVLRLETGPLQTEAIALYRARGYRRIDCWGAYAGNGFSLCFERRLGE